MRKHELPKEWRSFIVNPNAQPGKNSTLLKTYKRNILVRFLRTGCNTTIANLAIFVEKHYVKLTEIIPTKILFDIVNIFPSIDNNRGVAAVKSALDSRT